VLQLAAACLPVLWVGISMAAAQWSGPVAAVVAANGLFPAMALVSGGVGGFQFPVASRWYFEDGAASGGPGTVYAADVIGAFAGAVLISVYLVPVFGFVDTAIVLACVNAIPAVLVWRAAATVNACRPRRTRRL
jgi:predicted membrane-bound spermidine synthase